MKLCVLTFLVIVAIATAEQCGKFQYSVEDKDKNLPWSVQLKERSTNDVVCTGTLISDRHALFGNFLLLPQR